MITDAVGYSLLLFPVHIKLRLALIEMESWNMMVRKTDRIIVSC